MHNMVALDANNEFTVNTTDNNYMTPGMVFDDMPRENGMGTWQLALYLKVDSYIIESSPIYFMPDVYEPRNSKNNPYLSFSIQLMVSDEAGMLVHRVNIDFLLLMQVTDVGFFPEARRLQGVQLLTELACAALFPLIFPLISAWLVIFHLIFYYCYFVINGNREQK